MPNYSKNDIILVQYPFSNLFSEKIRPNATSKNTQTKLLVAPTLTLIILVTMATAHHLSRIMMHLHE